MLDLGFAERAMGALGIGREEKKPFAETARLFIALSEKARREGLLALEEDIPAMADPDMRSLMTMVVDGFDPSDIDDIASLKAAASPKDAGGAFRIFLLWLGTRLVQAGDSPRKVGMYLTEAFGADADLLGELERPSETAASAPASEPSAGAAVDEAGLEEVEALIALPFLSDPEGWNRLSSADAELVEIAARGELARAAGILRDCGEQIAPALFSTVADEARRLSLIRAFYERIPLLARSDEASEYRRVLAAILDSLSGREYDSLVALADSSKAEGDLAGRMRRDSFRFGDLAALADRDIQKLLRELEPTCLVRALSGAGRELRDRILANMSRNAANVVREDLEYLGDLGAGVAAKSQGEILRLAKALAAQGEIRLR